MNSKKKKSTYILAKAKKLKAINYKGGKCIHCGNNHIENFSFHHRDPSGKEDDIATMIYGRWSTVVSELDKCDLVCHNCHRGLHESEIDPFGRCAINKMSYLTYKKTSCCSKCGYDKLNSALEFHHVDPEEKSFDMYLLREKYTSVDKIPIDVKNELDKCVVLCANCHATVHFDSNLYKMYEEEIKHKMMTMQEQQPKIDRQLVADLLEEGFRQKDIAKKLNASKGTISGIAKELKQAAVV